MSIGFASALRPGRFPGVTSGPLRGAGGSAVDPGLALLQSATLWLDASDPGADSQKVQNKGTGGSALDARYGSTTGVDTNDPLLLTHTGTNYLYLPGVAGNHATVPDSAALSVTGDLEILVRVAAADWTPSTGQVIAAKSDGTSNRTWQLYLETTGALALSVSTDGTNYVAASYSSVPALTDGTAYWIRVTRTASTGAITYEWAADSTSTPSSWTSIGGYTATTAALSDNASLMRIGDNSAAGSFPFAGRIFRTIVRSTIGGANQLDADFTANTGQSSFTESSSNAATVTINRATSGRKSVMVVRPTLLFGTDDYLEVADNALLDIDTNEQMTVLVAHREWATPVANSCIVTKLTGNFDEGWSLIRIAGATHQIRAFMDSGASNVTAASGITYTAGSYGLRGIQIDRVAQTALGSDGSTLGSTASIAALGTFVNAAPLRVGTNGGTAASYTDMEVTHVAVFKGDLLDSTELGQIATYLGV